MTAARRGLATIAGGLALTFGDKLLLLSALLVLAVFLYRLLGSPTHAQHIVAIITAARSRTDPSTPASDITASDVTAVGRTSPSPAHPAADPNPTDLCPDALRSRAHRRHRMTDPHDARLRDPHPVTETGLIRPSGARPATSGERRDAAGHRQEP